MSDLLRLTKWKISGLIAMSALTGYLTGAAGLSPAAIAITLGVFLLTCGAAALNQVQEAAIDARMKRTRRRPIPSGNLSATTGKRIALLLITCGLLALYLAGGPVPAMLGALGTAIYNGAYTPCKRKSGLVLLVGGVSGSIPPAIGWISAGGSMHAPALLVIMVFFFLWQVPHFWLIQLLHEDDFRRTGVPSLVTVAPLHLVGRIILVWILATCSLTLLFPLFNLIETGWLAGIQGVAGTGIVAVGFRSLKKYRERPARVSLLLKSVNGFVILTMAVLIIDKQIGY